MSLPSLRVLSMWNPWAFLASWIPPDRELPAKQWESRHWAPRQRLPIPIALHATKRDETKVFRNEWPFKDLLDAAHLHEPGDGRSKHAGAVRLGSGSIIAIGIIAEVRPTSPHVLFPVPLAAVLRDEELALGDYSPGRFGWRLADVWAIPRGIPFKGRQEPLYVLPTAVQTQIEEQLYLCNVPRWTQ